MKAKYPHKHAFVGTDAQGDACIYIVLLEADGTTGPYMSQSALQKVADKINSMRILKGSQPSDS